MMRLHDPNLAAVVFLYLPTGIEPANGVLRQNEIDRINRVNQRLHERMLADGRWHLHQFSLPDDLGRLRPGATLYPLRFMANNPRTTVAHMADVLAYVNGLGQAIEGEVL